MVDRISGSLAREAILAAIEQQSASARSVRDEARLAFDAALGAGGRSPEAAQAGAGGPAAASGLVEGLRALDQEVRAGAPAELAQELLAGRVEDLHEIATRINKARIGFEFALEIRNRLIDAYRETMRMSV